MLNDVTTTSDVTVGFKNSQYKNQVKNKATFLIYLNYFVQIWLVSSKPSYDFALYYKKL